MVDPFALLGIEPSMELSRDELEESYHQLSRKCHPDFNPVENESERIAVLARAAELNDAFHRLTDPWDRAQCLIERIDADAMAGTKKLPSEFLIGAMELAEEVAGARNGERAALGARLRERLERYLSEIAAELDAGRAELAAGLLHESRYYRKALHDLEDPEEL